MIQLLPDLLHVLWSIASASPTVTIGAVWWGATVLGRRQGIGWGLLLLAAPIVVPVWLHRNRKDLRAVVWGYAVAGVLIAWAWVLSASADARFAVCVALPLALAAGAWWWLMTTYPTLTPWAATALAWAEWHHREVLVPATEAAAPGARVVDVRGLPDGAVEADVIGPAGMSHDDLIGALRSTLAESVLAISGRHLDGVSVVGKGSPGHVVVRCTTSDPYSRTIRLEDL